MFIPPLLILFDVLTDRSSEYLQIVSTDICSGKEKHSNNLEQLLSKPKKSRHAVIARLEFCKCFRKSNEYQPNWNNSRTGPLPDCTTFFVEFQCFEVATHIEID